MPGSTEEKSPNAGWSPERTGFEQEDQTPASIGHDTSEERVESRISSCKRGKFFEMPSLEQDLSLPNSSKAAGELLSALKDDRSATAWGEAG